MLIAAALTGGLAFLVASWVVGLRLLSLARRTRELPELCLGAGLFVMGGLGYPLRLIATHAAALPDGVRVALLVAQMTLSVLSMTAIAYFTLRVFRPDSVVGTGLTAAVFAVSASLAVWQAIDPGVLAFVTEMGPWRQFATVSVFVLGWTSGESLRYWAMMRRRQRLGLADPIVVDRFLLWGAAILCAAVISLASLTLQLMGVDTMKLVVSGLLVGPLGVIASLGLWIAFLPPSAYVRWVQTRGGAAA